MEGILISLDRDAKRGQVYSRNDDAGILTIYFDTELFELPREIQQNCTVEFDVAISKKGNPYAKFVSVIKDFTCEKIIRELYYLTPPWGLFELQVWDESSDEIIDSLSFSKNKDREEIKPEEKRLYELIGKISHASCGNPHRYDMSIVNGLACDYTAKVYVRKENYN